MDSSSSGYARVRAFLDFWNFQLAVRDRIGKDAQLDWKALGPWLAEQAGQVLGIPAERIRYEGLGVYLSYNAKSSKDAALRNWATTVLDRFPGVQVKAKERKPKAPPTCPTCHEVVSTCPHCSASMASQLPLR